MDLVYLTHCSIISTQNSAYFVGAQNMFVKWTWLDERLHLFNPLVQFIYSYSLMQHIVWCVCVCVCVYVCAHAFSYVWLFVTPWTVAHQSPLSMGFPWQEHWNGLSFISPGDLPNSGTELLSLALAGRFFIIAPPGKPYSMKSDLNFS